MTDWGVLFFWACLSCPEIGISTSLQRSTCWSHCVLSERFRTRSDTNNDMCPHFRQRQTSKALVFILTHRVEHIFTMNFNSNLNDSASSLCTSFHDSLNQSQFRLDSPAVSTWRKSMINENSVPPQARPVSPSLERLTSDLRLTNDLSLSPWENKANLSFSELSLRDTEGLTPQIAVAKVAWSIKRNTCYPTSAVEVWIH